MPWELGDVLLYVPGPRELGDVLLYVHIGATGAWGRSVVCAGATGAWAGAGSLGTFLGPRECANVLYHVGATGVSDGLCAPRRVVLMQARASTAGRQFGSRTARAKGI